MKKPASVALDTREAYLMNMPQPVLQRETNNGQRGRQNTIAAHMTHVDFPLMTVTVRESEALTAEGDLEHQGESDGHAPETGQPLDREKHGTSEVQRPQHRKTHNNPDQHHP